MHKSSKYMGKFGLVLIGIFLMSTISANLPIYIKNLDSNTAHTHTFNFTSDDSCSTVLLSNISTSTSGSDGIAFYSINISSLSSTPKRLCVYNSTDLIANLSFSDIIFNSERMYGNLIADSGNFTNNVTASKFIGDGSYLTNLPSAQNYSHLSNFTNDPGYYNQFLVNASELEHQGDGKLGILDSFINLLMDNRITQAFIKALGFYDNTEVYNKTEINDSFVPYSGANSNVNLNGKNLTNVTKGEFAYIDKIEGSEPGTPPADTLRLFVIEQDGFSRYNYKDEYGVVRTINDDEIIVNNSYGYELSAFRFVYVTGYSNGIPVVAKAKADDTSTMPSICVTIENIPAHGLGRCMMTGLLEKVNTDSFDIGILYISEVTAGIVTNTAPTTPNLTQEMGAVLVKDAAFGKIQIIARALTGDEYGTINNFIIAKNLTVMGNNICNSTSCYSFYDLLLDTDTTIGNCSGDQSCDNVIYESDLPLANKTTPHCSNITGAASDLCTIIDTTGGADGNVSSICSDNEVLLGQDTTTCVNLNDTIDNRDTDTNETLRMENLTSYDCSGTDKVVGVYDNGTIKCGSDTTGGTGDFSFSDFQGSFDENLSAVDQDLNVNSSLSINTSIGYIKDVNDTQFNLVNFILTLDTSWLDTLITALGYVKSAITEGTFQASFDTNLTGVLPLENKTSVSWLNLTGKPANLDINSLDDIIQGNFQTSFDLNLSAELPFENETSVSWNNLTGVPAGFADGTDDDTIFTPTNVAWINESNVFAEDQNFSQNITIDDSICFNAACSVRMYYNGSDLIIE